MHPRRYLRVECPRIVTIDHPRPGHLQPLFIQFFRAPRGARLHRGDVIRCESIVYRCARLISGSSISETTRNPARKRTYANARGGGGGGGESIGGIDRLIREINGEREGVEWIGTEWNRLVDRWLRREGVRGEKIVVIQTNFLRKDNQRILECIYIYIEK